MSLPPEEATRTAENTQKEGEKDLARFIAAADLQEIKRIHITGCTLVYGDDRTLQEKMFMDKIEKSTHFASAEIIKRLKPGELNLTGFDIYLTLKEPIKK